MKGLAEIRRENWEATKASPRQAQANYWEEQAIEARKHLRVLLTAYERGAVNDNLARSVRAFLYGE